FGFDREFDEGVALASQHHGQRGRALECARQARRCQSELRRRSLYHNDESPSGGSTQSEAPLDVHRHAAIQMSIKWKSQRGSLPGLEQLSTEQAKRGLLRDALRRNEQRDIAFRRMILSIPPGKVSTYGGIAAAAGYPRYHRAVVRILRTDPLDHLPWHRVVGAGAREQRAQLKLMLFSKSRCSKDSHCSS